jgi:hypothetical protein
MVPFVPCVWLLAAIPNEGVGEAPPSHVVGGENVAVCDFPASVFIGDPGGFHCTGSLVHPRVVITAAHCIGGISHIGFGEVVWESTIEVPVVECAPHPSYWDWGIDLGVCTLAADAPPVAMVPVIMGCEAEELVPGKEVVLAGFGQNDEASGSGGGIKRTTSNSLDAVSYEANEVYLLGDANGSCYGDSGGPAYTQLADGSWRVIGAVSGPHPNAPPLGCGFGGTYELIHPEIAWIEDATGYDVTPCFDADGTWNPDERCTEFPLELAGTGGEWMESCMPVPLSGAGQSCGAPHPDLDPEPDPGADTGGTDEGGDATGHVDGGDPSDDGGDSTAALDDGTDVGDGSDPQDDEDDDGAPPRDDALPPGFGLTDGGAGCRLGAGPAPGSMVLVILALVGRKRRRSNRRSSACSCARSSSPRT